MRTPSVLHRLGSALVAATFLFAVDTSAAGLRSCPHHDRAPADHATQGAIDHAAHAPGADQTPVAPQHEDGACTCLGGAQCAATVALHATAPPVVAAAAPNTTWTALPLRHQTPARIPSLFLPEATAPPAVL